MGIVWDSNSFARFRRDLEAVRQRLALAQAQAAEEVAGQILTDCLDPSLGPTVPLAAHNGGTLRGAGTWEVTEGALPSLAAGAEQGGENTTTGAPGRLVLWVGYNTVYAAALHEGGWATGPLAGVRIQNWSEPGSGAKWLETRLIERRQEYVESWAQLTRRNLGIEN